MFNKTRRAAWSVLWAAIGINFLSGILYIWSIIGKALMKELHWSSLESSLPYTVFSLSFAAAMVPAGSIQDRKGPRFVATIGSLLVGCGLILTGLTLHPVVMIFSFGIMTGGGIGSLYAATVPPSLKWFPPEKKGMINGLIIAMAALSSLMYSPLTNSLANSIGISPVFWSIGVGLLILMTSLSQFLKNPSSEPMPANRENRAEAGIDIKPSQMIRTKNFYKMWFMFACSAASGLMVIGHAANIAKIQAGYEAGFILVILLAVFNGIGRSFGGILSDKIGRPNLMRLTFIIQAANMFLFAFYTNYIILMIGVAVTGMCYGAGMVIFSASTSDLYGMKYFGTNYGLVFTSWGIAGVLGPIPCAAIFDATKSFNAAYLVSGSMVIAALIIALTFKLPRKEHSSGAQ